jgi:hypothetical protein
VGKKKKEKHVVPYLVDGARQISTKPEGLRSMPMIFLPKLEKSGKIDGRWEGGGWWW